MKFLDTGITGLVEIVPDRYQDDRGFFMETYNYNRFAEAGIKDHFVQDNHSFSHKGVLRGLHFQRPPHGQAKLLRVIKGSIIDVAVDIRKDSPTFGQHKKFKLDATNAHMLYIPEGFAHGFITLEEAIVHYKCSAHYHKPSEDGIRWDDPELKIDWEVEAPILSERDTQWGTLKEYVV